MSEEVVRLEPVKLKTISIAIEGITPLLMNKFSDSQKEEMMDKHLHRTKQKAARDIEKEVEERIHRLPDGRVGFPSIGFKKAMVEVAPYLQGMNKKLAKGAFFIKGDLVPIEYDEMVVNEAVVRLSGAGRVAQVRYRPQFNNWRCVLHIQYNANQISPEQIVNLANLAGFHIGVGDWTPQHDGQYGMFMVATKKEED